MIAGSQKISRNAIKSGFFTGYTGYKAINRGVMEATKLLDPVVGAVKCISILISEELVNFRIELYPIKDDQELALRTLDFMHHLNGCKIKIPAPGFYGGPEYDIYGIMIDPHYLTTFEVVEYKDGVEIPQKNDNSAVLGYVAQGLEMLAIRTAQALINYLTTDW